MATHATDIIHTHAPAHYTYRAGPALYMHSTHAHTLIIHTQTLILHSRLTVIMIDVHIHARRSHRAACASLHFSKRLTLATRAPCPPRQRPPRRNPVARRRMSPAGPSRCGGRSATARSARARCPAWKVSRPSMARRGVVSTRRRRREIRLRPVRPQWPAARSYSRRPGCSLARRSASDLT